MIAGSLFLVVLINKFVCYKGFSEIDLRTTNQILTSIGSIIALLTSVAFAFIVFFANQTNNHKHDLFFKFKSMLFDLDRFLRDYKPKLKIVQQTQAVSWDLKRLRIQDFPVLDWDAKLSHLLPLLKKGDSTTSKDPNLSNKILGYLNHIEEIISEIGLLCIRQIISRIFVNLFLKALSLMGILLLTMLAGYLDISDSINIIVSASPIFFAVFECLLLVEIGFYITKESDEWIDFVQKDK